MFFIVGIFMLLKFNAFQYIREAKVGAEVRVFLKEDADVDYLKMEIEKEKGVEEVVWLSEEYALEEFKKEFKLVNLPESIINPLPASFRVVLAPEYKTTEYLSYFSTKLEALDGVGSVVYGREYIQTICRISKYFSWLSYSIGGLLFSLVFLTITTSLSHQLLTLKRTTSLLYSFGISKFRLKIRIGSRAFVENIGLSGIAIGLIYFGYRFFFANSMVCKFLPTSFILGFVGVCGLLTFIISMTKKI